MELVYLLTFTLPETNIAHEHPIFLGKYHQNGGFSMAMLVYSGGYHKNQPSCIGKNAIVPRIP